MYANDRQRVRYALSQMKNLIFDVMHNWVIDVEEVLITKSFFKVIKNYMRFHHQVKNAKKKLLIVKMKNNENVSKYYHRIFKLWQKAKTSLKDRIETFLIIVKSGIYSSLMRKEFNNFEDLLKTARRIEARRKDVTHIFSRRDNRFEKIVDKNQNQIQSCINSSQFSFRINLSQKSSSTSMSFIDHFNEKFESVNKKLSDWIDEWFDEEKDSLKLTFKNKRKLFKQRRCWSCRESNHRNNDAVCINFDRKKNLNKLDIVSLRLASI
jgi:hypothetical protein